MVVRIRFIYLLFIILISFGAIGGCGNNGGEQDGTQALTENDFAEDTVIFANPTRGVVVTFLEPPDSEKPENDTGEVGSDIIPYRYNENLNHTYCFTDDKDDSKHFMILLNSDGEEVLRVEANGECVTEVIEAGDYVMVLTHGEHVDKIDPIFLIPTTEGEQVTKRDGFDQKGIKTTNGFSSQMHRYIPRGFVKVFESISNVFTRLARAQGTGTPSENRTTLLSTNKCVGCDLFFANLTETILVDADLSGANLVKAILIKANLTGAILEAADLTKAFLTETILVDAILIEAILVDEDLRETILTNADLTKADLSGANLMGNATLAGAILTEAILVDADLSGADLTEAILVHADLRGAILVEAILVDADLSRAGLGLPGADLTGANLTGANLTGAGLVGTTWCDGRTCLASSIGFCELEGHFFDNCDGTISDTNTDLMWEKKTGRFFEVVICDSTDTCPDPHDVNNTYDWTTDFIGPDFDGTINTSFDGTASTVFLAQLNDVAGDGSNCFARHCDWRLPELTELETIAPVLACEFHNQFLFSDPACNPTIFSPTNAHYWSATTQPPPATPQRAWALDISSTPPAALGVIKSSLLPVRAVRSGP